jgi:hypothetical protein
MEALSSALQRYVTSLTLFFRALNPCSQRSVLYRFTLFHFISSSYNKLTVRSKVSTAQSIRIARATSH